MSNYQVAQNDEESNTWNNNDKLLNTRISFPQKHIFCKTRFGIKETGNIKNVCWWLKKFIQSKAFTVINSIKLFQFPEDKNTEGSQTLVHLLFNHLMWLSVRETFLKHLLQITELKYIIMKNTKYRVLYLTTLKLTEVDSWRDVNKMHESVPW